MCSRDCLVWFAEAGCSTPQVILYLLQPASMVPCSVLLPSIQACSDLGVLPCVQGLNICRLLLTGWDAVDTIPPPSRGEQLQEEWEGMRTLRFPPQPYVGKEPRRPTAASSCVANRQGWENKKREILPGDKSSAATRMAAKQGLGEENRVAACRTFDQVMKIQGQKSSLGCFGQLNCFILPSLSNRQKTDLPVCLGFFRRKEYECFNSPTTT